MSVDCVAHVIILSLLRRYEAGDHVAVYPTNNLEMVEKLGERLGADLETLFTLDNVDGEIFMVW